MAHALGCVGLCLSFLCALAFAVRADPAQDDTELRAQLLRLSQRRILDNQFHLMGGERDRRPPSRPVVVEVGARAILLPGARIGKGAVVPPGAVISRSLGAAGSGRAEPEGPRPADRDSLSDEWNLPSRSLAKRNSIRIGDRTMFGSMVRVCDRGKAAAQPVVIGDDVWVAHGAIIEPGVTIGSGSVVAAGSVVSCDVPPRSLAIGNPARCLSLSLRADVTG
jgi:serine acetyltransferase